MILIASLSASPFMAKAKPIVPKLSTGNKLALAIEEETGGRKASESGHVTLQVPDIAEDGAIVPVTVESTLPGVDAIWVFVEKNPTPLAAKFSLEKSLDPFVSLRVKMNESCEVVALVRSGGEYFSASKKVRVVVGGCG